MAARRFFVVGNWKMNGSKQKIDEILQFLNSDKLSSETEVVCAPPSLYVSYVKDNLTGNVQVSLQNCMNVSSGAYTGEVAAEMGEDMGCSWVILGHTERRHKFGESSVHIGEKAKHVLTNTKMGVIACIGERTEQEANKTMEVCAEQLKAFAANIPNWNKVVIAYDAVWATGTGKAATPDQAQEVHEQVRSWLATNVNSGVAQATRILYGGSVSGGNCSELSKKADIDGFLVGAASLKPDFVNIVNARMQSR